MTNWTADHIPTQQGRIAIVTGGNIGLGYQSVLALVRKNAHVIIASRSQEKADNAQRMILADVPQAKIEVMRLDLSDLASVRSFAAAFCAKHDRLDILLNNAGVMIPPYGKTKDGFEMQFGTNHLGHFALTGLLLETLMATPHSRVVSVSSNASSSGSINFDDLQSEKNYVRWTAYGQSKLANSLFMRELARRLSEAGSTMIAAGAHPGYSATDLQNPTKMEGAGFEQFMMGIANRIIAQSAAMGSLPQLYAATAPDVLSGEYFGPRHKWRGYPAREMLLPNALDSEVGKRLWEVSETLTGVRFEALAAPLSAK